MKKRRKPVSLPASGAFIRRPGAAAFTLIELSIVLVIIGLIVGGVLVGQDLIKAAQARKIISEKDAIDAAVYTFKGKYDALPGDMPNATTYWGSAGNACNQYYNGAGFVSGGPTCNGNGDGNIDWAKLTAGTYTGESASQEVMWFWHHLYNAKLINLAYPTRLGAQVDTSTIGDAAIPGQTIPLSNSGLGAWEAVYWNNVVLTEAFGNCNFGDSGFMGNCWGQPNVLEFAGDAAGWGFGGTTAALTPAMAYNIDLKIDDGHPDAGSVRGSATNGFACTVTNAGVVSYNITTASPQCSPAFLMGW
jgi:prepilin-type N-terminal cleavage/methylation domain-containing protein